MHVVVPSMVNTNCLRSTDRTDLNDNVNQLPIAVATSCYIAVHSHSRRDRLAVNSDCRHCVLGCTKVKLVRFKMVNAILSLSLLLSVVCVTHGQSTAGDNSGCVYSFKVPTSDCAQTPGPSVDDQILRNSVLALQEQVKQLVTEVRNLKKEGAASPTGRSSGSHINYRLLAGAVLKSVSQRVKSLRKNTARISYLCYKIKAETS